MSVIATIDAIKSGLMWIGLWALGLCLVALLGCAISGKRHFCRFPWSRQARPSPEGSGESAASPRPSRSVLVGIALLAIVCTLFGGGKMRNGGGGRGATALPGVTAEEIAQGWRLESVVTNDAVSYVMPTNGVEYVPWSLRGGYETHFPLDLGDFAFPFGTGVVHRLDVLSGGMVESLPRQRVGGRYSSASASSGDVRVSGSFTDAVTGESISNSAVQTAVRVMLGPRVEAPRNDSPRRHSYGVCELVQCGQEPSMPVVTWNPVGGGSIEAFAGSDHYRCPLDGCVNPLRAEVGAVHYTPKISVVEPDGMSSFATKPLVYSNEVHIGEAGGIGMKLHLYVTPLDVSFSEIAVEEVPCLNYEAHGYFENPYFNGFSGHTVEVGAGNWYDVDINNRFANYDEAAYYAKIPWLTPNGLETTNTAYAWTDGTLYMDNPFGWNVKGTTNGPPHKVFGEDVRATFMLDENGRVGVFKLDNWVDRQTNGVVRLFGPKEKDE